MGDIDELPRLRRKLHEVCDRMTAQFARIEKMFTEYSATINILIERDRAPAEQPADQGRTVDAQPACAAMPEQAGSGEPWERAAATQEVADAIADVVAYAREAGVDDEAILARLQDAADALREGADMSETITPGCS